MTRWYQEEIMERWKKDGDNENFYIFLPYWIFQNLFLLFVCFRRRLCLVLARKVLEPEQFTGQKSWSTEEKSLMVKMRKEKEKKREKKCSLKAVGQWWRRSKDAKRNLGSRDLLQYILNGGKSCSFVNKNHSCLWNILRSHDRYKHDIVMKSVHD